MEQTEQIATVTSWRDKLDWNTVIYSVICAVYSALSFGYGTNGLKHWTLVLMLLLPVMVALISFCYQRKIDGQTDDHAKRERLAGIATDLAFCGSMAILLIPFYNDIRVGFSVFEVLFPVVAGAVIGFAFYFKLRFWHRWRNDVTLRVRDPLEFELWKMMLNQIMWAYGFVIMGAVLGLDKTEVLMGIGDGAEATVVDGIRFLIGILVIVGGFHFLIAARIFGRMWKIIRG